MTEAANSSGKTFGKDALLRTLAECNKTAPADVNNFVKDRVEKFVGDEPLQDDIAMLTLHYNGPVAQA